MLHTDEHVGLCSTVEILRSTFATRMGTGILSANIWLPKAQTAQSAILRAWLVLRAYPKSNDVDVSCFIFDMDVRGWMKQNVLQCGFGYAAYGKSEGTHHLVVLQGWLWSLNYKSYSPERRKCISSFVPTVGRMWDITAVIINHQLISWVLRSRCIMVSLIQKLRSSLAI